MIKRAKVVRRWKFWLLGWVRVLDGLVIVLSLGYLTGRFYSNVIFSDWANDIDKGA